MVRRPFSFFHRWLGRPKGRRFNPYVAGTPIFNGPMFFGRRQLTDHVRAALHRGHVWLTGERRIGKTSFLHHLKRTLEAGDGPGPRCFPVYADVRAVRDSALYAALVSEALDTLALEPGLLGRLRAAARSPSYGEADFAHDAAAMAHALGQRTERPTRLVFLIDELGSLDGLGNGGGERLRAALHALGDRVSVVGGATRGTGTERNGAPCLEPAEVVEIGGLTPAEARALVEKPVLGRLRYRPEATERILALSALRPYEIQKLCSHAIALVLEQGRSSVELEDVEAVSQAILPHRFGGQMSLT
jgi:hypothetical protein